MTLPAGGRILLFLAPRHPRPQPPGVAPVHLQAMNHVACQMAHLVRLLSQSQKRTQMQWPQRWPHALRSACTRACSLMGRLRARGLVAGAASLVFPRRIVRIP